MSISFLAFFSFLASDIYAGIVWGIHRVGKEHSLCLRLLRVLPQSERHGLSRFIQCPRTPPFCISRTHSFRPSLSGITYTPSLHHRPYFPQYSFRFICNGVEWSKDKTQAAESIKWRPQQAYGSNQFLLVQPQTVFSTHKIITLTHR